MGHRCDPEKHEHYLALEERLWNVHHAGEPMPGAEQADEDADIIMEGSRADISKNPKCPISGVEASLLPTVLAARPCSESPMLTACSCGIPLKVICGRASAQEELSAQRLVQASLCCRCCSSRSLLWMRWALCMRRRPSTTGSASSLAVVNSLSELPLQVLPGSFATHLESLSLCASADHSHIAHLNTSFSCRLKTFVDLQAGGTMITGSCRKFLIG